MAQPSTQACRPPICLSVACPCLTPQQDLPHSLDHPGHTLCAHLNYKPSGWGSLVPSAAAGSDGFVVGMNVHCLSQQVKDDQVKDDQKTQVNTDTEL